ncbi:hypothetical protein JW960_11515 [candidate division KSB1 bacterium]|nr:hypothetical protein [candidate division KSB1 bacterium]
MRRRQKRTHNSPVKRFFFILIGLLIVLLGMLLWFIPGPGWLTIFIGAVIIARESLLVARFLDWLELKLMKTADKYFM